MTGTFFCRLAFGILALIGGKVLIRAQTITTTPASQTASSGESVTFTIGASGSGSLTYQWFKDGSAVAGANGPSLTVAGIQPIHAGIYTAVVSSGATSASASAILGFTTTAKVTGAGTEVAADILHPTGNIYDQILLQGAAAAITADPGQVTRISYIDLNDDIVQVEFAGAGTLTLQLYNPSGPAPPLNYNQANVSYMKGHARIVIAGANESTNASVFSVGRANAVNQALFRSEVVYDGLADIASIAITGGNGRFGGLRSANASFFAANGFTGLYAPEVQFNGPVYVGDIGAFDDATPVLMVGSVVDLRITGGDLFQNNGRAVQVSGIPPPNYTNGTTSHGSLIGFKTNRAVFQRNGVDVTAQLVPKPNSPLYFAQLRPGANAGSSTASGFASISLLDDGTALISVNISNLSSGQTSAYLRVAGTGDAIFGLPRGQVSQSFWVIGAVGSYSRNDIVNALNEGRLYVSLETAKYPAGEVSGSLLTAVGSTVFTVPLAPPVLPPLTLSSPSDIDAARLLIQATFGATDSTVAEVRQLGIPGWIKMQMALPPTSLLTAVRLDATTFPNPSTDPENGAPLSRVTQNNHSFAWWKVALTSPDQLRQRVAFALSELFVAATDDDARRAEPYAQYYDLLVNGAFGNFRTLLEKVTLHPEMGWFLTFAQNQKADPIKGTSPDENYAREIQQLFTIGLVQLQPDGTLKLDTGGRPIPTFDNITITETAKVFTGWAYVTADNNFYSNAYGDPGGFDNTRLYSDNNGRMLPMKCYETFHDTTEKRVIGLQQLPPREAVPTVIPANQTGTADLKILLDALFNHPNTGPFIVKQLIQRLVTSNPSTGYVFRVANVFANNGAGVRGDLGAVVTAILSDYEARSPEVLSNIGFGKVKEPLLRLTALMRVLKTAAPNGRFADSYFFDPRDDGNNFQPTGLFPWFGHFTAGLGQAPQHAASVFNFFSPYYSTPGALADYGLVAPELQITDSTLALKVPNLLTTLLFKEPAVVANAPVPSPFLRHDCNELMELSTAPQVLLERLNLLLCGGGMTLATKTVILEILSSLPLVPALNNKGTPTRFAINTSGSSLTPAPLAAFDPAGPFTIEAWIFPTAKTAPNSTWVIGKLGAFSGDPFQHFSLTLGGPGASQDKVVFAASTGVVGSRRSITSPAAVPVGVWTHVAGVHEGTQLRLYINGMQVAQGAALGPPKADPVAPFSVGGGVRSQQQPWGYENFEGLISQPRYWKIARSAAQITTGMNEGQPSDRSGLIAGWMLDEGPSTGGNPPVGVWRTRPSASTDIASTDYSGNNHTLQRSQPNDGSSCWVPTNGRSLERVLTALQLTIGSPDSAVQR